MKVLVGTPVFRLAGTVRNHLEPLAATPADILVIDNAADQDVKQVVASFGIRFTVITNETNGYCNGAWNQILEYGLQHDYDVIGLGTSDVTLHPGWYDVVTKRMQEFPKEVLIPAEGPPVSNPSHLAVSFNTPGWYFSFMPKEAAKLAYPIPRTVKHWYGDTYMYYRLTTNGFKIVLMDQARCYHQTSSITAVTPESYDVIGQDHIEWAKLQPIDYGAK